MTLSGLSLSSLTGGAALVAVMMTAMAMLAVKSGVHLPKCAATDVRGTDQVRPPSCGPFPAAPLRAAKAR